MDFIKKFKSFFAKKKETYEIPFERVIEMMKSEEMFAKDVIKEDSEFGAIKYWENSTYFDYLLNLVYKSGVENVIKLMNSDVKTLNKTEIERYVLNKKDGNWSYEWLKAGFGKDNFGKHQQIVIDSANPTTAFYFASDIEGGANLDLSQIVLEKGSAPLSKNFAQVINKYSYPHLEKYVDYLVNYVGVNGEMDSDDSIQKWVQDVFKDEMILGKYPNLLAKDTKENKKLKEYITKYAEAMLKRRDLDSIKADEIVIAGRF